jgi:hypothetical protein
MKFKAQKTKRGARRSKYIPNFSELGEGRSKSIYIEPLVTDTAVLMSFFNPAKFRRNINNICYIMKILKEKKIPCYVIECVFDNEAPQIPGANLVVRSKSYMFYKEQLINKLEKIVPEQYTKLVILDSDIMFDAPDWLDQVSVCLDKKDIIQPYEKASYLTPDNKRVRAWKYGQAYALVKNTEITEKNLSAYHPGFAWALRRDIFRKIGGLFPNAIIGSGDAFFTYCFYKDGVPDFWYKKYNSLAMKEIYATWLKYYENFKQVNPTLGYIPIKCLHLFHGLMLKRLYDSRYYNYLSSGFNSWDSSITYNKDGLTEFTNPDLHHSLFNYFKDRDEDIPLYKAMNLMLHKTRKPHVTMLNRSDSNEPSSDKGPG